MSTIGSIPSSLFQQNTNGVTGTSSSNSGSGATTQSAADPLANESTFLQLLVAQLKNQNPSQPMDGTTFVTQLAQFSDLEQNLAMRQDLDSIDTKYAGTAASATSANGTNGQPTQNSQSNQPSGTTGS